jgi:hypothetical protein
VALRREVAYPLFEELVEAGHDAYLHGRSPTHRPISEGKAYSVTARTPWQEGAGVIAEVFAALDQIGNRHGVKAWFTTTSTESYDGEPVSYGAVVRFEER